MFESSTSSIHRLLWTPSLLLQALECLTQQLHLPWSQEEAKRAIEPVISDSFSAEQGFSILQKAGEILQMSLSLVDCSLRELVHGSENLFPLVTIVNSKIWMIQKRKGKKLYAIDVEEYREKGWFSAKSLGDILVTSVDEPLCFILATPMQSIEISLGKQREHPSPIQRFWHLLKLERTDIIAVFIYSACIGLFSLTIPVGVQSLVNTVARGVLLQPVIVLAFLVFLGLGLSGLLRGLQIYIVEILQQRLFVRTALELAHRFIRLHPSVYEKSDIPEQANRFFDVVTLQKSLSGLLLEGLSLVLQMGIGFVVLGFYHPILLAFDLFLFVLVAILLLGLGRQAIKTSIAESAAKYKVAAWLEELGRYKTVFRSTLGKNKALEQLHLLARDYIQKRKSHFRILFRQIVGSLWIQAVLSAALLGVGGALVMWGQLTLGQLFSAEIIVGGILASIAKFDKHLENFYDLNAALDKLGHLTDLKEESVLGSQPRMKNRGMALVVKHSLEMENEQTLWTDLTFVAEPSTKMVLVSRNPVSLQRFAEILWREKELQKGIIELDGLALSAWKREALRSQMMWLSKPEIFSGSILENIQFDASTCSVEEVYAALKEVNLYEEILTLPDGIYTPLFSEGTPLSPIQKRQLLLARALVQKPGLLLISEPFFAPLLGQEPWLYILFRVLFHGSSPWTVILLATPSFAKKLEVILPREAAPVVLSFESEDLYATKDF